MLPRALLLCFALLLTAAPAAVASKPYIVVLEPGVESVDRETGRLARKSGFQARLRFKHALKGFSARLDAAQVADLRADPDVASVVPDRSVHARALVPLASGEPLPPTGGRRVEAMTTTMVREPATSAVAVLDTGVDLDHPDLNVSDGTNCVTPGRPADDDGGHGTHVAGIVGARNNGSGTVGMAPGTRVYAVKVLDAEGSGEWSQVICGIDWVTANARRLGISVANMSLGGPTQERTACAGDPLHSAICDMTSAGVLAVAAAGNESVDFGGTYDAPSSYPEVLAVTGMADLDGRPGRLAVPGCGETDDRAISYSNYATRAADLAHAIAAPGTCILSTRMGGGVVSMSGTSMSTPHAAAAAALCVGEGTTPGPCAGLAPAGIVDLLIARAKAKAEASGGTFGFRGDPLNPLPSGRRYGYLLWAPPPGTPTPTPSPSPTPGASTSPTPEPTATAQPEATPAPEEPVVEEPPATATATPTATPPQLAPVIAGPEMSLRVRVPRQSRSRVLSRGLRLEITCSVRCRASTRLLTSAGAARARISRAFPGRRLTLLVRLSPSARRAVLRRKPLTVQVRALGSNGARASVDRRLRF